MTRLRLFVWLIALVAFIAPAGASAAPHQAAPQEQAALSDCPDHAPPPKPCPEQGTAKHAASACCPLMSGTIALLPLTAVDGMSSSVEPPLLTLAHRLTGLIFTQDPPPPRV
jgi:hypothetical protein